MENYNNKKHSSRGLEDSNLWYSVQDQINHKADETRKNGAFELRSKMRKKGATNHNIKAIIFLCSTMCLAKGLRGPYSRHGSDTECHKGR